MLKLASSNRTVSCIVAAMFAIGMTLAACKDEAPDVPPTEQQVRKALPMDGFEDLAGVEKRYATPVTDPQFTASMGKKLANEFRQGQRCANCHAMPDSNATLGPSLFGVASRYTRTLGSEAKARVWLHNKIWDPTKFPGLSTAAYGRSDMPIGRAYYTEEEIASMVEYLMTLKS